MITNAKQLFDKLLRRPAAAVPMPPLDPDRPFVAVGDIHGRADLLEALLVRLADESPMLPRVFVGDYIDRGDDSRTVVDLLMRETKEGAVCLMGNHERMLLDFLDDPEEVGPRWVRYGGLQTLASFGATAVGMSMKDTAARLGEALGATRIGWLQRLPLMHISGNVAVVHAGADPSVPIDGQKTDALLWGHPKFGRQQRSDGMWVLHGHTIVESPYASRGTIAIDTGAYATGQLTAVRVGPGNCTFLTSDT